MLEHEHLSVSTSQKENDYPSLSRYQLPIAPLTGEGHIPTYVLEF